MGRLEMSMMPRLEMRLKMAPQIIQSIEILQLPLLALQERIEQEQLENPTLELDEEPVLQAGEDRPRELTKAEAAEVSDDFSRVSRVSDDFHDYFWQTSSRTAPINRDKDPKLEALQNTPGRRPSLRDHLAEQLRFLDLTLRQRETCEAIINNLDRDGRLAYDIEGIAASLDDPSTMKEIGEALAVVQSLDPPGIGARDLKECLLLQIDPTDAGYDLQRLLIMNHLPDIEANRYPKMEREIGRSLDEIKAAVGAVCMLHPAPGRLYDNEVVPLVVPDVHVELIDGRYSIRLDEKGMPRLRISTLYHDMLDEGQGGKETKQFLSKKIGSARWLIEAIQQRRRTILRVSKEIVGSQKEFFDHGLSHLRPLKMQEVADVLGMHVATVSRAIRHKYMQTPRGLFPMKFFFTGGTRSAEGEMQAWDAVKQRINEIVEKEDKVHPLSDEDIMNKLAEEGIHIARRTVTKYRKTLNIASSRQRKRY